PSSGLLTNWNNKPVWWWPNLDTPAWGVLFRNEVLNRSLTATKISVANVEHAAWDIARQDTDTNGAFIPLFRSALENKYGRVNAPEAAKQLMAFDGWKLDGSIPGLIYQESVRELRKLLFLGDLGNLTQESLFEQAVQPSVILRTIQGKTKYDWLAGRSVDDVAVEAYEAAIARLTTTRGEDIAKWGYVSGSM